MDTSTRGGVATRERHKAAWTASKENTSRQRTGRRPRFAAAQRGGEDRLQGATGERNLLRQSSWRAQAGELACVCARASRDAPSGVEGGESG